MDEATPVPSIEPAAEDPEVDDISPAVLSQSTPASHTNLHTFDPSVSEGLRSGLGRLLKEQKAHPSILLRKKADGYMESKGRVTLKASSRSTRRLSGTGLWPGSSDVQSRHVNVAAEDNTVKLPSTKPRAIAGKTVTCIAIAPARDRRNTKSPAQLELPSLYERPPKKGESRNVAVRHGLKPKVKKDQPTGKSKILKGLSDWTVGAPVGPAE